MESFLVTVIYSGLAAPAVVALVIYSWFNAAVARQEAHSRASPLRTAATGRMRHDRRVT